MQNRAELHATNSSGFTLLEILLVIIILTVTTMMVAPSFISLSSPSLQDEAKRFVQAMRLASDEAMLSGRPFRVALKRNSYRFERPDAEGVWRASEEPVYGHYQMAEPFAFSAVRPDNGLSDSAAPEKSEEKPDIGHILLLPDGVHTLSEIDMRGGASKLTILIQPGPDGITLRSASHE